MHIIEALILVVLEVRVNHSQLKVYPTTFWQFERVIFTVFWVGLPGLFLLFWCVVLDELHLNKLLEVFPGVPFLVVIRGILVFVSLLSFFILFFFFWTFVFLCFGPESIKTLPNHILHITLLLSINEPMVLNYVKFTLNSKGKSWCISKHNSLHWSRYFIDLDAETLLVSSKL